MFVFNQIFVSVFDAWSRYDEKATPVYLSDIYRRPADKQKALVEFMRDGPQSVQQAGHWLKFAQDVSVRDNHTLDQDVKMFFSQPGDSHGCLHCLLVQKCSTITPGIMSWFTNIMKAKK